ncbi:class I SAM-dependent rRNA methyltransferase [Haliangium sp.]|uniref:class I SAM-dependent rRNA methyltransferase n=1 Tax=Haliangium sp. TaxID=2663208 RepID=UPI003D0D8125
MATRDRGGSTRRRRSGRPIVRRGTVRLQYDVARRIRLGHPWVYREAVGSRPLREAPGAPIELVDDNGDFLARGIFDGESAIAVRVMTRDPDERIGPEMIRARVASAVALRRRLLDWDGLESMRLINGEADGLPAVVVERYGRYLVIQLFTPAFNDYREALYDALEAELSPAAIYEQRRFRSLAGDAPRAAELVRGSPAPVEFEVSEGALRFWVDVTAPLSTGLFADLREGRRVIARWAKGRRVLNLFSYTGAVSVYAAHGGASAVAAVDVSAKAHARARKNFALNGFDAETPEHIVGDCFKVLARFADRGRRFDMVIIDPPAFASATRGGKAWSAVKDYGELVAGALDVLEPGGLLAAASSTRKISAEDFDLALAEGATRVRTTLRVIDRAALPSDFPTLPGFPEGNYLKFVVCTRD